MRGKRGFDENIFKPPCLTQQVNVGCDLRWVEFFTGVTRETRHCRCGWDAVKADKFDFFDYRMSGEAGGIRGMFYNRGIASLGTRDGRSGNKQPEKRYNQGSATALHLLHLKTT